PEQRRALIDGGLDAVKLSNDPAIGLAKLIEPEYRRLRLIDDQLSEREKQAYAKIARVITAVEGTTGYPDATFTLRLAFGTVKGYTENGTFIEPTTDFAGAFEHAEEHQGQEDFDLPESWIQAKKADRIDLSTQLNFVCTADIIG